MRPLLLLTALLALAAPLGARAADPAPAAVVKTPHVESRLVAQTSGAAPGGDLYVAVRQTIAPGWHTYWRNPGDSGEAAMLTWTLPPGWTAGDIVWPTPGREHTGPLVNYVYSDRVDLPVALHVPAAAKPGATARLVVKVDYLVCQDVCVPETAVLSLDEPVVAGAPAPDPAYGAEVTAALLGAPKPAGLAATFSTEGTPPTAVKLSVSGEGVAGADASHAWFYPYDGTVIDHAKPELVTSGPKGLTLTLAAGFGFTHGATPKALAGVLALGPDKAFEVSAVPGPPEAGTAGAVPVASDSAGAAPPGGGTKVAGDAPAGGLLGAVGFAFLGGLILNLMPCVFPVLSIKAAQLARHVENPAEAKAEGIAFLLGAVLTFVALAAALLLARAGGQAVGWGFQLQSPAVVAVLALVMLLAALNLSGVFEVGTSVQGAGSGLASRGGLVGAFFTGLLAVVVAAPCSAPFMAGAIGWAVTQPPAAALLVFAALGLGLAAPLTAVSFSPALFRRLPKPGAWMEGLRKFLAFPMYGAAAWLAWVFALQTGPTGLPALFAAAVVLAFAAWLWGVAQRGSRVVPSRVAAVVAAVLALGFVVAGAKEGGPAVATAATVQPSGGGGLSAEAWSPARVAELTAQGRPVLVDFTAAWCVTCQVNERTALAGKGVADAFARTHAAYLKADWTKRDATIAQALAAQGRSGVPLYLMYGVDGGAPKVLPQLLSEGLVVSAVEAASKRPV